MSNEDIVQCERCGTVLLEDHWSGLCEDCFDDDEVMKGEEYDS